MALNLFGLIISFISIISLLITPISHAKRNIPSEKTSSPFDPIKDFDDNKLKTYLKTFGYLENNPETLANDDNLESAIKTFQENYNIKPTGTLDAETISRMAAPRCGVPDIINGTNYMQRRRPNPNPNSNSIHTVSHYDLVGDEFRWPASKTHLSYKFLGDFPEQAILPVDLAFKKWASVTHFTFSHDQNNEVTDITIGFYSGDHGDGQPFVGWDRVVAHGFLPTDGRLHFNVDVGWFYLFRTNNAYDILTFSLHEIGHLLGLGHSSIREAVMFPYTNAGEIKDLHEDDIQGVKALYNH